MTTNVPAPQTLATPEPPLVLAMPEPVVPVSESSVAMAMVPLPEQTQTAVEAQAQQYIEDLPKLDVSSDEFRARVDSAFRLGRKEIGDSTLMTNKFLDKSFVKDADNPAFAVINEMRTLFEGLDPGKEGDLLQSNKLLGLIPFGNKLQAYLRRFDSASDSIRKLLDHMYAVQDELARDDQELYATMNKLLAAMGKLKSVDLFIDQLDTRLTSLAAQLKERDPVRAKAVEQEVLFYARQASQDIKTQMIICINGYKMLEGLRKSGRELRNGCDRMATIGMSSLSIAVTLARAQGYQMKVMEALRASSNAIEGLIASTTKMFGEHTDRVIEFQSNPLVGVQTLKTAFDTTFAALDKLDEFRSKSIETMGGNIAQLRQLIAVGEERMNRSKDASQAAHQITTASSGPVTL